METEISQTQSGPTEITKSTSRTRSILLGIIIFSFLCIAVLGTFVIMLYKSNNKLDNNLISTQSEIQLFKAEVLTLKSRLKVIEDNDVSKAAFIVTDSVLNDKKITVQEMQKSIEDLQHSDFFNGLQHRIEGGVVTDDFVVDHIDFLYLNALSGKGKISATIDLSTQPVISSKYKGRGAFDIPDRELKAKMNDIIIAVSKRYFGFDLYKGFPKWEEGTYDVTIKNYEIGTYKNGVFKLKGE